MEDNNLKKYKYKVDKLERYFSFAILIIFFMTFNGNVGFYVFTVFAVIVFAYYFKFYRVKPLYISIEEDCVTVSQGLFFKLKTFKISEIDSINKYENKIELILNQGEKIVLIKFLLGESDYLEIYNELSIGTAKKFE